MKRLFCLFLAAGLAHAADTVELSARSPRDSKVPGTLSISRLEAEVKMRGMLAETQVTLTLSMEADPVKKMEGRLLFPLPPDCLITGAALDIGTIMRPASVTFKETAQQAYDAVVSRMLDPCLVQLLPDGGVSAQVFPFDGGEPRVLRLEFAQTVPPGGAWHFPLKFAVPVPEAELKADVPAVLRSERRAQFTGDWSFTSPPAGGKIMASGEGAGPFLFHALVPPGEPAEPPQHVLVLADASLMQAPRDEAAERAFLERLFQKMQTGRVTLATFSTVLHSRTEFVVENGTCEGVLAALRALPFDGAPRPGAVDLSDIPADLTLVLSTLSVPMGGTSVPRLPSRSPVWVLDSVSPAPSATARWLATDSGGVALNPRSAPEMPFRRRSVISSDDLTAIRLHGLSGGGALLTGELAGESGVLTINGQARRVVKGTDASAGPLIARARERISFLRLAEESRRLLQSNLRAGKNAAPFLSESVALIVLEQPADYERFGIPLPPDLVRLGLRQPEERRDDNAGFREYQRALRRPAGTVGDPEEWHYRVRRGGNRGELEGSGEKKRRFEAYRRMFGMLPERLDWVEESDSYKESVKKAGEAVVELGRLSRAYRKASPAEAVPLIRRGRQQQLPVMQRMELLTDYYESGIMRSGGAPGADPFSGPGGLAYEVARNHVDAFASGNSNSASGSGRGGGSGSAEPFAVVEPAPAVAISPPVPDVVEPPPAPAPAAGVQVPQTFGGGGAGLFGNQFNTQNGSPLDRFYYGGPGTARTEAAARETVRQQTLQEAILARAARLHAAGQQADAIRALSGLAIPGQDDHARLRLLAWMLQEWGETALALEVLNHAEVRFGDSDTTARDLGLAALAAGRREEALQHLRRVQHHVARRDLAALEGIMSAPLRVVVECAGANGDVNLEIEGPDYELCSWRNPLPAFGGVLSFDGAGEAPEDFVFPSPPVQPLHVRFRLTGSRPQPVRVTVIEAWGLPAEKRRVFLLPQCSSGRHEVVRIPAGAQ
jgi:hypothetical protein